MTSTRLSGSRITRISERMDELADVRSERERAMQAVFDAQERARRRLDPIHELRARQTFRRQVNPCPGGAC